MLDDPPVHVFVMGRNKWRRAADWPLPGTQYVSYYLHSDGQAHSPNGSGTLSTKPPTDEPPDQYVYDPHDPTPSAAFANGHIDGPRDISESAARADVLVYDTPPLAEDEAFARVSSAVVAFPRLAREAAAGALRERGMRVQLYDELLEGDALETGRQVVHAARARAGVVHLWGSETTVVLPEHPGRGGRCQRFRGFRRDILRRSRVVPATSRSRCC